MKMKNASLFSNCLLISGLISTGVLSLNVSANENKTEQVDEKPFEFYTLKEFRPFETIIETDYSSWVELKFLNINDNNHTFGKYNGLSESGAHIALSGEYTHWQENNSGIASNNNSAIDYWQATALNLGLKTGEFGFELGAVKDFKLSLDYTGYFHAKNSTGLTPFKQQGETLKLPSNWHAGLSTDEMSEFYNIATPFEQSLERNRLDLAYSDELSEAWQINSSYRHETKKGSQAVGASFYANAQNGHASILPAPIDYTTHQFDFGVGYHAENYNLMSTYLYSRFENGATSLQWQNPYSADLGIGTQYPNAYGQLGVAPSNELHQIRLIGNYIATYKLRLSGDVSYSIGKQDDALLPPTSNTALPGSQTNTQSFSGEVNSTMAKAKAHYRWNNKLSLQYLTRYEDRSNKSNRQGYQPVFGDSWAPQDPKFQLYNRPYSRTLWLNEIKASYRLPASNKLDLSLGFEQIDRYNHAVETTEESQVELVWRSNYFAQLSSRISLEFKDRAASTYHWDQGYYALFDSQLINETPDSQRFTNHPLMSQYYLSNREQIMAKWAVGYQLSNAWQLSTELFYKTNDYEQSTLGLLEDSLGHVSLNAAWFPYNDFNLTAYLSYDYYESIQMGRAYRGGIEKNPFEVYQPLPQASDPSRNWQLAPEDKTLSLGLNGFWEAIEDTLELSANYRWLDSTSEYSSFSSGGAQDISNLALPNALSEEHHFSIDAAYFARTNLTFNLNYQFYQYSGADWTFDNVSPTTLDKVLGTGEYTPDDSIHLISFSATYRFQ